MNPQRKKIKTGKSPMKQGIMDLIKHPVGRNLATGFCICPSCGHWIFDVSLSGNCPYCHKHFCPSCVVIQRKS